MLHEPDHQPAFTRVQAGMPPQDCPLDAAITALAGKWKLSLLRTLFLAGPHRYNQLLKAVPGINPKELTRNLRELEYAGLVLRVSSDASAAYGLTELGLTLRPAFQALGEFGSRYRQSRQPPAKAG